MKLEITSPNNPKYLSVRAKTIASNRSQLSMPVKEASALFSSLRDDLMARTEAKAATRAATAESDCLEAQETLTEELEERLRKHWPRKGRTEVWR